MKKQTTINPSVLADKYRKLFEAFLVKGFNTEQSFQLLLAVVKKSKKI